MNSRTFKKSQHFNRKSANGGRGAANPRSFWEEQRDAFKLSGLKVKDFCGARGLAYSTFTKWMGKLSNEDVPPKGKFVRLEVEGYSSLSGDTRQKQDQEQDLDLESHILALTTSPPSAEVVEQIAQSPELKLSFGKGLILHIPLGFDASTLRHVVETLA